MIACLALPIGLGSSLGSRTGMCDFALTSGRTETKASGSDLPDLDWLAAFVEGTDAGFTCDEAELATGRAARKTARIESFVANNTRYSLRMAITEPPLAVFTSYKNGQTPGLSGGLNGSTQHFPEVYSQESENLKFVVGVDLSAALLCSDPTGNSRSGLRS